MPVTFERVAEVSVGDRVSAANLANLARSINGRLVSGLGDAAYRLVIYWLAAARQIRNPDALGNYPAQGEFFTSYQGLSGDFAWPDAPAGENEGVNVSSLVGSYVFGNSQGNVYDEATRLVVDGIPVETANSASAAWNLGKRQRGAYDPTTRGVASPAATAAISYGSLTRGPFSPHGNSYGGFFPIPDGAGATCADGTESLLIQFTNLKTGAVTSYPGSCVENANDAAAVYRMPLGYYVVKGSGAVDYYPRSEWIEGPYTRGEHPMHAWGDHLPRVMAQFSSQFRGTNAQRQDEIAGRPWLGNAFHIAHFLTRPYYLAPAIGTEVGGEIFPQYPTGRLNGTAFSAGTRIGGKYKTNDGFAMAAAYVEASGLVGSASVEFRNGSAVIGTATISNANPSAIVTFSTGQTGDELAAYLTTAAQFSGTGSITVEWAELVDQKPGLNDLFTVLRLMGCKTVDAIGTDGSGLAESEAKTLWQSYAANGCVSLIGDHAELQSSTTLGENAFYDTLRRMSKVVRWIPRQNFVAYAVEDGNSVLWVRPEYQATPRSSKTDALDGITDAIATDAPPRGYSNEWVGFVNTHPYHVSESSLWKPSTFADYWPIIDRCMFYTTPVNSPTLEMKRFLTYNASDLNVMVNPEAASGHRYAKTGNQEAVGQPSFYKSCRIYEPPLAVKSAESQTDGTVKITFDGRFHHHESAPASISRDIGTWNLANLTAEADDYRTVENAVREYLVHAQGSGSYQCSRLGWGNEHSVRAASALPDNPFGACYPTLFLVQQIPKPYLDGNDRQDGNDTPFESAVMRQAEFYLRVMCEGFVDKHTTEASGCASSTTFDFRWEQLCYQATGMPWLIPIGDAASKYLPASEVREDRPEGFGPMPTTMASASVFNGFARACNLLTRVRVSLPWSLEVASTTPTNSTVAAPGFTLADGSAQDCSTFTNGGLLWSGRQPDVAAGALGAYGAASYVNSSLDTVVAYSGGSYTCSGANFQLSTDRTDQAYRFSYVDADAENAIPEAWRTQLQTDGEFVATQATSRRRVSWTPVSYGSGEICGAVEAWDTGTGSLSISHTDEVETECRTFPATGTVSAPAQSSIRLAAAKEGGSLCDAGATYSSGLVSRTLTPQDTSTLVFAVPVSEPALVS